MKKVMLLLFVWITIANAAKPGEFLKLDPFCVTVDKKGISTGVYTWYIPTDNLVGNQIIGQFYRFDKRPLKQFLFDDSELDKFLANYGKEFICYGPGNYFLVERGNKIILISVNRIIDSFEKNEYWNPNEILIPVLNRDFMKIYIPMEKLEST